MADQRRTYGQLACALGAAALGAAVFAPWYGLVLTQTGVESARQTFTEVAQQYGNALLQSSAGSLSAQLGSLTGRQLATFSAHDVLKDLSVVLLILAAVGLVTALVNLAGIARTGRGQIALVGALAAACVLYRMLDRPAAPEGLFTLSLHWGAWLALAGALAMIVGDLHRASPGRAPSESDLARAFEDLSGWTPSG